MPSKLSVFPVIMLISVTVLGADAVTVPLTTTTPYDPTTILTVATALLALITIVVKGFTGNNWKKDHADLKSEFEKFKVEIKEIVNNQEIYSKIETLKNDHDALYKTVNEHLKNKVTSLSENITKLEDKIAELNKHFDDVNADRKEESRQIKHDINSLRENIREDINDVKDIIMKLMMALKTESD